jgi:hypothetical protein
MSEQFRVLVCGGREYDNMPKVCEVLDIVHAKYGDRLVIVTGAQRKWMSSVKRFVGADYLAEEWARSRQVDYMGFPAKWNRDGKRAGMHRNRHMFVSSAPQAVIAFPGGVGTAGMCDIARRAGITPWEVAA